MSSNRKQELELFTEAIRLATQERIAFLDAPAVRMSTYAIGSRYLNQQ